MPQTLVWEVEVYLHSFLNHRPLYSRGRTPLHTEQEARWAPKPVWTVLVKSPFWPLTGLESWTVLYPRSGELSIRIRVIEKMKSC